MSGAGDVNGAGFDDVVLGASRAPEGGIDRGAAFVVFGRAGGFGASFALGTLNGANGFKLGGVANQDNLGEAVSGAGDVNGDGFADVLIGALGANDGAISSGAAFVVFGKAGGFSAFVTQASLDGSTGFRISGVSENDQAGNSVSSAGDVNGDGYADLLIGADGVEEGGVSTGTSYVVFGKAGGFTANLVLSALDGTNGFKLPGVASGDSVGSAVSGAGDVNGDGFADVIIGAPFADEGGTERGAAYVVFGFGTADVVVAPGKKSATFTDWDGDRVTITTDKGKLDAGQFRLSSPNPLTGGAHLVYTDFTAATTGTEFAGASLSFSAVRDATGGDGLVNVGTLDARGVVLGSVKIAGDLQQLDAAGAAALKVGSLGQFAGAEVHGALLTSEIDGRLGSLKVKSDARGVTVSAGTFGAIKAVNLDGVSIFARGVMNPGTNAAALAIASLTISGSVSGSQILAGYDALGVAVNADVAVGAVSVAGQWIASDLVAGGRAGADGVFATADDSLIPGGNAIVAKIAGITIGGAALGTLGNLRDGFGFVAEKIGAMSIGKALVPLANGARNDLAPLPVGIGGDLRVREIID